MQGSRSLALLAAFLGWAGSLCAAEPADPATWRVWLEPRFMHAPVTAPVRGAERTEFAGGSLQGDDLRAFTREEWDSLGVAWPEYEERARANAAQELASLKPEYVRNRRKVIQYAVLRSERPIVAEAVLAPKFLDLFQDTLGPKVLVAVPNRSTAYVFPALVTDYRDYVALILTDYHATAFPVSVEIFEFSAEGVKAIGVFEGP